jgi:mRNA-degrading endonuclease toxin of MazEF toxin-antitoxin module
VTVDADELARRSGKVAKSTLDHVDEAETWWKWTHSGNR